MLTVSGQSKPDHQSQSTANNSSASVDARRKQLDALLKEQWEYVLRTSPEFASILGDKRYNDQLTDFSQAAIERDQKVTREYLKKFEAIDTTGFPEQERLNKELMVRNLRNSVDDVRFKGWEMPVTQFGGIHIDLPELVTSLSFATVKDYDDYIARLKQVPRAFDETIVQMRKGMKDKLMPPEILLKQVVEQANNIAVQKAEDTPFAEPLKKFPKDFSEADQKRLREGVLAALDQSVLPTYKKFVAFVRDEYAPHGTATSPPHITKGFRVTTCRSRSRRSCLPPFRQNAFYSAFIEGWALYSERLGKEVGFYQDPYNDFGRLDDEILRAVRLVVDTGVHYKKWNRDQVVQYMRDHTSNGEAGIQSETDRYIAWPGQALAYKVGQLTILRLREKSKSELGDKFDIRAFHDEVIGVGALPLDVLERRIDDWITQQKNGSNSGD
jgi:uncharacterized protein (DUF885 family)